jgi:dihydrofolate synthase / folylpolyglutamate synthase
MARLRNFQEVRTVLAGFVPPAGTLHKNYTLKRMRELMEKLGNPQDTYKVIHVAGTSGKTSTSYFMAALLKAAGQKVGLTVSPHIDEVNERVQINLEPLPEAKFCRELSEFLNIVAETGIKPTYFEVLVAFAFWKFDRAEVDYAVVEVGMGGLLDGTNVISRADKVCVITDIGLDHTRILGKTLPEIATQKAGIILPRNPLFTYRATTGEVLDVIRQIAAQKYADLEEVSLPPAEKLPADLPLFQKRNWYLAYEVYAYLIGRDGLPVLSKEQLHETAQTYIPARMEIIRMHDKTVILDGAHNRQKMDTLAASITDKFLDQPIATLFSVVKDDAFPERINPAPLVKLSCHLIITGFAGAQDFPKVSVPPAAVAKYLNQLGFQEAEVIDNPEAAFAALLKRPEPVLLVTGSFYLMNHIRPLIFGEAKSD